MPLDIIETASFLDTLVRIRIILKPFWINSAHSLLNLFQILLLPVDLQVRPAVLLIDELQLFKKLLASIFPSFDDLSGAYWNKVELSEMSLKLFEELGNAP